MHKHATLRAWQREEDGSYKAELHGCTLHVTWRPEQPGTQRGFLYRVEGPHGYIRESDDVVEEIDAAMVHAEELAKLAPAGDE